MKFLKKIKAAKRFRNNTSKYYLKVVQYNKGVWEDACNFNLVTQEAINNKYKKLVGLRKLKFALSDFLVRIFF
jgi:hypothetical protein